MSRTPLRCLRPAWVLVSLLGALAGGCAAPDPLLRWQSALESYVRQHGNGDLSVLRTAGDARSRYAPRPALATFGENDVPRGFAGGQDVLGVLLGCRTVADRTWYVYLVAVCDQDATTTPGTPRGAIRDIRLVAVRDERGTLDWRVSAPSDGALEIYRRSPAVAPAGGTARMLFPRAVDVFRLHVDQQTLRASEQHSGASWTLMLSPPGGAGGVTRGD